MILHYFVFYVKFEGYVNILTVIIHLWSVYNLDTSFAIA